MKAEIIAVGSELLTPDRLDTNSLYLTEQLNTIGHRGRAQDNRRRQRVVAARSVSRGAGARRADYFVGRAGADAGRSDARDCGRSARAALAARRKNRAIHSGAISLAGPRDAGAEYSAGDGAGRRGGARESARHRAGIVDRGFGAFHRVAAGAAARVEADVSRTRNAKARAPRFGRAACFSGNCA